MAVDTRNKRFNCLSVMRAYTVAAPNPDAAISSQADRQQIAWSYSGILSSGAAPDVVWSITFTPGQRLVGGLAVAATVGGLAVSTTSGGLVVSELLT